DQGPARAVLRGGVGRHHHDPGRQRGRQDHHPPRGVQDGEDRRPGAVRRPAHRRQEHRGDRPARHRAHSRRARHLRRPVGGRKPPARGLRAPGPGRAVGGLREDLPVLPGAGPAAPPAGGHALGRRAADARGGARPDVASAPLAPRRALAGPRPAGGARDLPHRAHHQRARAGELAPRGAERGNAPRLGPPRLPARDRAGRDVGPGQRAEEGRRDPPLLSRILRRDETHEPQGHETEANDHEPPRAGPKARPDEPRGDESEAVGGLGGGAPRAPPQLEMDIFVQQVVSVLATGGIYASLALALVMIYQATDVVNFAQGEMAMFSTYLAWSMMQAGLPYWGTFLATVAIAFVGGLLIERIVIRPVENAPILTIVIVTLGLLVIFNSVAGWIYSYIQKTL